MSLRTLRASPTEIRKLHRPVDVGTRTFPTHFEKVKPGVYRVTDRAGCFVCRAEDQTAEIERLRERLTELVGARS